jgi:hypothetical protein
MTHPLLRKLAASTAEAEHYREGDLGPGVPERKTSTLPDIKKPETWEFSAHPHAAERAGMHIDMRLGNPKSGIAHSFVLPGRDSLPGPGEMARVIPTFDHTIKYMDYMGPITSSYGKGEVLKGRRTQADVYHMTPEETPGTKIRFNLYDGTHPEEFAIRRDGDNWFLHNKTQTRDRRPDLPSAKPEMKEVGLDDIDPNDKDQILMPKLDGAHSIIDLQAGRSPRLFSYRVGKVSQTGLIEHTHKLRDLLTHKVSDILGDTILRGEIIGVKNGKAIPAEQLTGFLNSKVWESRRKQDDEKVKLQAYPFNVIKYQGRDVSDEPFHVKQEILAKVRQAIPELEHVPMLSDPKEKTFLLNSIRAKGYPLTDEGVVVVGPDGVKSIKAKVLPDYDVYVRKVHPAVSGSTGEAHDRTGAISYSWTANGPIVGRLGGFKHDEARDMLANPHQYIGRVAKVTARKVFKGPDGGNGAMFQPRFKEWHLDKGDIEKAAYNLDAHRKLIEHSVQTAVPMNHLVQNLISEGSVGTDVGTTFPLLPWNDLDHAFPTHAIEEVDRHIKRTFNEGVENVANSIETGSTIDGVYGLMQIGHAHHTLMDLGAHRHKLVEMGAAMPTAREMFRGLGSYGGWQSLIEHLKTKYRVDELAEKGEEGHKTDLASIARARDFGKQILPAVAGELARRGLPEDEAESKTRQFLASFKPSSPGKLIAKVRYFASGVTK